MISVKNTEFPPSISNLSHHLNSRIYLRAGFILASDLLAIATAFLVVYSAEKQTGHFQLLVDCKMLAIVFFSNSLWFFRLGHYTMLSCVYREPIDIVSAALLWLLSTLVISVLLSNSSGGSYVILFFLLVSVITIVFRYFMRQILQYWGKATIPMVVVGDGHALTSTLKAFSSYGASGYQVAATANFDLLLRGKNTSPARAIMTQTKTELLVVALSCDDAELEAQVHSVIGAESVRYFVCRQTAGRPTEPRRTSYLLGHDVQLIRGRDKLDDPIRQIAKRGFDIAFASVLIIMFAPIFVSIVLIMLAQGGDIFFIQRRIGRGGQPFGCIKFRTMVQDAGASLAGYFKLNPEAELEWRRAHKLTIDPRITRFGGFLRRFSLDEIPQLINVIVGDMSLVGPRPIVEAGVPHYNLNIAHYYRLRPGLTGLWQVSGRSNLSYAERVRLDTWFVDNWALRHDLAVLMMTLPALLRQDGAR